MNEMMAWLGISSVMASFVAKLGIAPLLNVTDWRNVCYCVAGYTTVGLLWFIGFMYFIDETDEIFFAFPDFNVIRTVGKKLDVLNLFDIKSDNANEINQDLEKNNQQKLAEQPKAEAKQFLRHAKSVLSLDLQVSICGDFFFSKNALFCFCFFS